MKKGPGFPGGMTRKNRIFCDSVALFNKLESVAGGPPRPGLCYAVGLRVPTQAHLPRTVTYRGVGPHCSDSGGPKAATAEVVNLCGTVAAISSHRPDLAVCIGSEVGSSARISHSL